MTVMGLRIKPRHVTMLDHLLDQRGECPAAQLRGWHQPVTELEAHGLIETDGDAWRLTHAGAVFARFLNPARKDAAA